MKSIISTIIILVCSLTESYSCSCIPPKSFCDQVVQSLEWNTDHLVVVRGKIVDIKREQHRRDLIIEIKESFHNPQNLHQIRIMDGNGADCGQNLDPYGRGDELIFMTYISEESGAIGKFSICDPGPLVVRNNRVSGRITGDQIDEISLNTFRKLNCIPPSDNISIYPNPASDLIHIVAEELWESSRMEIYLYNLAGQRILQYLPSAEEKIRGSWTIPLPNLAQGTYYLNSVGPNNKHSVSPVTILQ